MLASVDFFIYLCSDLIKIHLSYGRLSGGSLQFVKAGESGKAANPFAAKTISQTKKGLAQ